MKISFSGQAGCSMAFDVAYSYTRELFPTSMRSTAMGVGSGFARIGSMISALIALLEDYRWVKVVVVVVAVDVRVFYHFQFFLFANLKGNLPKCELLHRLSPIKFPGIILLIMSAGNSVIFFSKKNFQRPPAPVHLRRPCVRRRRPWRLGLAGDRQAQPAKLHGGGGAGGNDEELLALLEEEEDQD